MAVGPDVEPEGDIRIVEFSGGRYAVTRCEGLPTIGDTWKRLAGWLEDSEYTHAHHQWLEEVITPPRTPPDEMVLDLYIPIAD
jgi:DNA gyrase inhibitor GyrI